MREDQELENAFNEITGGEPFPSRDPEMPPDATQRVNINRAAAGAPRQPAANPQRDPSRPAAARQTSGQPQRRTAGSSKKAPEKKKFSLPFKLNDKVTIITLFAIAAVLLIAVIITLCVMFSSPADDGLILNGVYAAGVKLGGKTQEQAKQALQAATDYQGSGYRDRPVSRQNRRTAGCGFRGGSCL